MPIFVFLLFLATLLYALFLFAISKYWYRGKQTYESTPRPLDVASLPFFSIIVPARNESASIKACLRSLLQQDYPRDKVEIIVVDDHSEDTTAEYVRSFASEGVRLLKLSHHQQGKKTALSAGIEHAKGEFLLFTDADCTAGPDWLRSIAKLAVAGSNMILAPVRLRGKDGLLASFQGLDVAGTLLLTGAAVQAGRPILANGANLSISKKLFHHLQGFQGNLHRPSGDDIFLLQKAVNDPSAKISFAFSHHAIVETQGTDHWSEFFWQRLRWAGKTSGYTDSYLILFQAGVYLLNLGLFIAIPILFIAPAYVSYLLLVYLLKAVAEYQYLSFAAKELGHPQWMRWYVPSFFFHSLYICLIGTLALLSLSSRWKGRRV